MYDRMCARHTKIRHVLPSDSDEIYSAYHGPNYCPAGPQLEQSLQWECGHIDFVIIKKCGNYSAL